MAIVSKIKARGGYYRSRCGASDEQIASAEQTLGLKFPEEYRRLLKSSGILIFLLNVGLASGLVLTSTAVST